MNMAAQSVILVFLAGFAAAIGQVVLLRELLVLFCGNELSAGVILACWLLWTAAGSMLGSRFWRENSSLPLMFFGLSSFCVALPATVIWVRAARLVWSIPNGELLTAGAMAVIALSATGPICLIAGGLFAVGWKVCSLEWEGEKAIFVYLAEAAGSGIGGLVFYFVLLPKVPAFPATLLLAVILLVPMLAIAASSFVCRPGISLPRGRGSELSTSMEKTNSRDRRQATWAGSGRPWLMFAVSGLLLVSSVLFLFSGLIDSWTRRLQWGQTFLSSLDTPFHNLAMLRNSEQFTMFSNGVWLYSTPDPYTSEAAAHIALLEHPAPKKVLLIGDYSPDMPTEVLKHRGITKLDSIQPDARLAAFTKSLLSPSQPGAAGDARFSVFHGDPKAFIKSAGHVFYDVIILSAGEPVNAEMNRFYTVEFFAALKSIMHPSGIFSFAIPSAPDILGERQALLLKSLHMTLRECFKNVLVIPGETARFLAANRPGILTEDPGVLIERLRSRSIATVHVRDFYLLDCFNSMRLSYVQSILSGTLPTRINRDIQPACYLYGLAIWSSQVHPRVGRVFSKLLDPGIQTVIIIGLPAILFLSALVLRVRSGLKAAVAFNTGISGAAVIVAEIVLILLFQVRYGTVYEKIALIVSAFMAGMACGSWIASLGKGNDPLGRLRLILVVLAGYAAVLFLMTAAFPDVDISSAGASNTMMFLVIALAGGSLGGMQFAAAAGAVGRDKGAMLYAADLAGAAVGAVAASLFLLPVFGIPRTMLLIGLAVVAGIISLPADSHDVRNS